MATTFEKHTLGALHGWKSLPDNPFAGSWKLISCDAYRRNGQVVPLYGPDPDGRLCYDAAGNMSVQVARAGRPRFRLAQKARGTDDELRDAFLGYEAYFATYEVDEERGVIDHHVTGALFPNWAGTIQPRYFRFEGPDRLILSTAPMEGLPARRSIVVLTWARLS